MNGDKGFILPFTLFVISLVLLLLAGSLQSYRMDLEITKSQTDQLKAESLFQMGREKWKAEQNGLPSPPSPFFYAFPDGDVIITPSSEGAKQLHLIFTIRLDSNGKIFTFTDSIHMQH